MKGLILAAGKGSRISDLSGGVPKSFLEIAGRKIIEHQIEAMRRAGTSEIGIVVGYNMHMFSEIWEKDSDIVLIKNPFFASCNVLGSVWCARNFLNEGFIFTHADTFFDYSILEELKGSQEEIILAIEKKPQYVDEEMKVRVEGQRIQEISKSIANSHAHGEFTGLAKISKSIAKRVIAGIEFRIERLGLLNEYFEAVLQQLIDEGVNVTALDIGQRFSIEIDFPEDYQRALDYVKAIGQ